MSDILSQATQPEQQQTTSGDALSTKLATIVNESGEQKYKDVETAIDALAASQEYIPTLRQEVASKDATIASLREELAKTQGVSEALAQFTTQQQSQAPATTQAQTEAPEATTSTAPSELDIDSKVRDLLAQHQQSTVEADNYKKVNDALASQYGDKAVEVLQGKAKELAVSPEYLQELAKQNPTMAMSVLGLKQPQTTSTTYGGYNTTALTHAKPEPLKAPERSLLAGAGTADVMDYMNKVRAEVYREHGITG